MAFTDELAAMRQEQAKYLTDTCIVKRRIMDRDSLGGADVAWGSFSLPCRIAAPDQITALHSAGISADAQVHATLTVAYDADIQAHDRVIVDGREFETYSVLPTSYRTAKRVLLKILE